MRYSLDYFRGQATYGWAKYRATFRVFKIERKLTGKEDLPFLERVFQKLLLNFTWYVTRPCDDWRFAYTND